MTKGVLQTWLSWDLWWEYFLWLWEWAQFNFKDPYKREAKSQSQRRRYDEGIRGWMMWGREQRSTGHLQELEKARKWILLQNHQKKYSPADTVILAQRDPCKLLIPRTVVHLHCFKPLHLCWSVTAVIVNEYNMPCTLKLPLPQDIFKEGTEQGAGASFPGNWNQSKPHTWKIYAWDEKLTLDFSHGVRLSKTYLVFLFLFYFKRILWDAELLTG